MTFEYLIRTCKLEKESNEEKNLIYLNGVLNHVMTFIEKEVKANPSIKMSDINEIIYDKVHIFLSQMEELSIRYKTIEYYLGTNSYSNDLNFRNTYKKICEDETAGKIDIDKLDLNSLRYTNNMKDNMEKMVMSSIYKIREAKKTYSKTEGMLEIIKDLVTKSSKERSAYIKKIVQGLNLSAEEKRNVAKELEEAYKLFVKPEIEVAEESFKEYTKTSSKRLKDECIKAIQTTTNLLDEFGLLEYYVESNNKSYKKIYINGINYNYDEVKEMLKEDNLRKLNIEDLIVMSAFWTNRVNKVIKQLNSTVYIINHQELIEEVATEDGFKYRVKNEDMKNVDFKMNVIHKLYFELFDQLQDKTKGKEIINLGRYLGGIARKHQGDYKEYFDLVFPDSENSLKNDLNMANIFENVRYNSYQIKDAYMQSLLISLFNSGNKKIENFGYIPEEDQNKKEILIAADIKGFNMPFSLHINKDIVLNFLEEYQGNTTIQLYKNMNDFKLSENILLKPQIFVPLTKEADNAIKYSASKTTPRDRYGKAVMHLNYLRKEGKMPKHMLREYIDEKGIKRVGYVRKYVDLGNCGGNRDIKQR